MSDALEEILNRSKPTVKPRNRELLTSQEQIQLPPPDNLELEPEIVQRALRLEEPIADLLKSLCDRGKVKQDVFIEAAILEISENPELLNSIITIARHRLHKRKELGYRRKVQTMVKNLER